jgi:membrane associated rhomboid family serine protease
MHFQRRIEGWYELEPVGRPGRTLRGLLIALPLVWLLQDSLNLLETFTLRPGDLLGGRPWTLLTYGWLHDTPLHLLFNLLGLWVFGSELERLWGGRRFLVYWIACLAGAGLAHSLLDPLLSGQALGVIGASGGVYGLIAAYGLIFSRRRLLLLGLFPVSAGWLALGFAGLALFSGVVQSSDGVAHFAHLGGMATGLALIYGQPLWRLLQVWRHQRRMRAHLARSRADDSPGPESAGNRPAEEPRRPGRSLRPEEVDRRVDDLLEKISREGLEALSDDERAFLDEAAQYKRRVREGGRG